MEGIVNTTELKTTPFYRIRHRRRNNNKGEDKKPKAEKKDKGKK